MTQRLSKNSEKDGSLMCRIMKSARQVLRMIKVIMSTSPFIKSILGTLTARSMQWIAFHRGRKVT